MGLFSRNTSGTPSDQEVRDAARQMQQGGVRGRGSSRRARQLTAKSDNPDATAGRILSAATEFETND